MLKQLEREKAWKVGLCQALLVSLYCGLVAIFFNFVVQALPEPGFYGFFLILTLLVFSAAVTGSLVFGYPVYLAVVNKKAKEADAILAYTLGFLFLMILATIIFFLTVAPQL